MHRSLLDRIEGIFIIVNALLPAILVIVLSFSFYLTYRSAVVALADYTRSIEHVIEQAKIAKGEVQKAGVQIADMAIQIKNDGQDISKKVDDMTKGVQRTLNGLGDTFADNVGKLALKVPVPVIKKDINIRFGKVLKEPMKKVGNAVAKPFKPMTRSFKDIGNSVASIKEQVANLTGALENLKHMEKYLDAVIVEYQNILDTVSQLAAIIGRLLKWIGMLIIALTLWFATSYLFWVRRRLMHGMQLLKPAH